jgi:hypothetical protein
VSEASLDGANAKLKRAGKHFKELTRLVNKFREKLDDQPYRLVRQEEFDGVDTTTFRYTAHIERPMPVLKWSPLIGDILYNARSALDHLAWQLAVIHCAPCRPPNGVRFPIFCSEKDFFKRMKDGRRWAFGSGVYQFRAMSHDAQALILELQPYKRRKNPERDPLWVLHQLCNEDKHETLPLVFSSVEIKTTILSDRDIDIRIPYKRRGPFSEDTEILRIVGKHTGPNPDMQVQTEFWVAEAFDKSGPAAGRLILDQLREILRDLTEEVFPQFGRFF